MSLLCALELSECGVLQGSHTPMKLGLILSPDSFRCLHIVCVCVCVCVCVMIHKWGLPTNTF